MTLLYILGSGSRWKDFELQMSFRSLERYVRGDYNVLLVGKSPDFKINQKFVKHIPANDPFPRNKEGNILYKILIGAKKCDSFILMNDDYIFLQTIPIEMLYPAYTRGNLETSRIDRYARSMNFTADFLQKNKRLTHNYDTHYPMKIISRKLLDVCNRVDWSRDDIPGYCVKSLYGNWFNVSQSQHPNQTDCKLSRGGLPAFIRDRLSRNYMVSLDNPSTDEYMRKYLRQLFPTKSKLEL